MPELPTRASKDKPLFISCPRCGRFVRCRLMQASTDDWLYDDVEFSGVCRCGMSYRVTASMPAEWLQSEADCDDPERRAKARNGLGWAPE